jgi:L-fuconolactonase
MAPLRVDAHQHFWNLDLVEYPWLTADLAPIRRTFEPPELEPQLRAAGIDCTVLVQAANSYADTDFMLQQANRYPWIGAVVGWVPLLEPAEAERALARYMDHPVFRGVRHLIHDEPDPDWIVQERALEGLQVLAAAGISFDFVAVFPNHLKHIPTVAERVPDLKIIIDHLAKPPLRTGNLEQWATELAAAARYPNVYAKLSGLNTVVDWDTWSAEDIKPAIDRAIELFGTERLMFGSDWPFGTLAGNHAKVWTETNRALSGRSSDDLDRLLGGTAQLVYTIRQR